jgi:hypothetical protein
MLRLEVCTRVKNFLLHKHTKVDEGRRCKAGPPSIYYSFKMKTNKRTLEIK